MVPRKVRSHGPKWVMAQASRRAPDGIPKQILGLEFARGRIDVDVLIAKSKLQQYQARGIDYPGVGRGRELPLPIQ
jgi:hypothetical protein